MMPFHDVLFLSQNGGTKFQSRIMMFSKKSSHLETCY
jgi:hypothetical protein